MIRPFLVGFATTLKHIFRKPITVNYPDEKVPVFPKYRGKQVLMRDENGLEKCVACGLCAVACPADAIYLEPAENDGTVQAGPRYAKVYQIHKTRCIFCGYCEEACPVSAIFMGKDYELAVYSNKDFIWDKQDLLVPARLAFGAASAGTVAQCQDCQDCQLESGQFAAEPVTPPVALAMLAMLALLAMKFGALGDIHGDFESTRRVMTRHPDMPFWLCVGDVADDEGRYEPLPAPLHWIKGNNENFDAIAAGVCSRQPELPAQRRPAEIGGLRVAGLGGTFAPSWYDTPAAAAAPARRGRRRRPSSPTSGGISSGKKSSVPAAHAGSTCC